jgi:hypothetical protein
VYNPYHPISLIGCRGKLQYITSSYLTNRQADFSIQMWSPSLLVFSGTLVIGTHAAVTNLTSPLGPVVDLGYTAYVGNSTSPTGQPNSTVTFFGGVRYAQPPLGDLRFRAPKDLDETYDPNRTVIDARSWGPICVQQPAKEGLGVEGTACLSS